MTLSQTLAANVFLSSLLWLGEHTYHFHHYFFLESSQHMHAIMGDYYIYVPGTTIPNFSSHNCSQRIQCSEWI